MLRFASYGFALLCFALLVGRELSHVTVCFVFLVGGGNSHTLRFALFRFALVIFFARARGQLSHVTIYYALFCFALHCFANLWNDKKQTKHML